MLDTCRLCKHFKVIKTKDIRLQGWIGKCKMHKEFGELEADEYCYDFEEVK